MSAWFEKLIADLSSVIGQFRFRDAIDIIIIAYLVYKVLMLTKGTRATQVLKGLGILLIGSFLAGVFRLQSTAWLLDQLVRAGTIAIVVLFQPELRRALEQIGRGKLFERSALSSQREVDTEKVITEIGIAMGNLAKRKVGALVVIERHTGLREIISTGTKIEGVVTAALLENIFEPNTPLHDGAVVIHGGVLMSAACFLPLSDDSSISRELGTRHRAAIGVSEISDCLAIVVSEETGHISCAQDGVLTRKLRVDQLRRVLSDAYEVGEKTESKVSLRNLFGKRKKDEPKDEE